jgi:hypothetical protein
MRYTLAIGLLAAFLAGPALRLDCLISCTAVEHAASTETCHSETSSEATVSTDAGHCISEALPITLALKRTDPRSPITTQARGVHTVASVADVATGAPDGPVTRLAASPPPLLISLRI